MEEGYIDECCWPGSASQAGHVRETKSANVVGQALQDMKGNDKTTLTNVGGQVLPAMEKDAEQTWNEATSTNAVGQALPARAGDMRQDRADVRKTYPTRFRACRKMKICLLLWFIASCDRFQTWFVEYGASVALDDWNLLCRARAMATHEAFEPWQRTTAVGQALPAMSTELTDPRRLQTRVFFLDVNALACVLPFQARTLVLPAEAATWPCGV